MTKNKKSFANYLDKHPEVSNVLLMDSGNKIIKKLKQDQAKNPDKSANETKEYEARIRGTNPNEVYKDNLDSIKELPDLTLNGSISKIVSPAALNKKDVENRVHELYQWHRDIPVDKDDAKFANILDKGHVKDALKNTIVNPEPTPLDVQYDNKKFKQSMAKINKYKKAHKINNSNKFSPKPSTNEKEYRNKSKLGKTPNSKLTKKQILAIKRSQSRHR